MKIINKIKSLFKFDNDVDLTRRKVIKTAAGLAALTVVGTVAPTALKLKFSEIDKQVKSGRVIGQTFYLTEPVIIDMSDVVIENCNFIAVNPLPYMLKMTENAHQCIIKNCYFKTNQLADVGVMVEPQGDINMARTMQSAFDAAASMDEPKIYLSPGKYRISSPITKKEGVKNG